MPLIDENMRRDLRDWRFWALMALVGGVLIGFMALLAADDARVATRPPPPPPATRPALQTEVLDVGQGITCVRLYRGEDTLRWDCLR